MPTDKELSILKPSNIIIIKSNNIIYDNQRAIVLNKYDKVVNIMFLSGSVNTKKFAIDFSKGSNSIECIGYTFAQKAIVNIETPHTIGGEYTIYDIEHYVRKNTIDDDIKYLIDRYLSNTINNQHTKFNYIQDEISKRTKYIYDTLLLTNIQYDNHFMLEMKNNVYNDFIQPVLIDKKVLHTLSIKEKKAVLPLPFQQEIIANMDRIINELEEISENKGIYGNSYYNIINSKYSFSSNYAVNNERINLA